MSDFATLLRQHRTARRWSMERLAEEADIDHSLISRLESDQRNPTHESLIKLCVALDLGQQDANRLWIASGFLPPDPEETIADEPGILALYRLLRDERVPDSARQNARHILDNLVSLVGLEVALTP
jgi:transcriptional regulator with XRE-family HTH domain